MGEISIEQALKDVSKRIRNVDTEISNLQNDRLEFNITVRDNQSPANFEDNGTNVTVYMAVEGVWDGKNTVELTGEMTECAGVRVFATGNIILLPSLNRERISESTD